MRGKREERREGRMDEGREGGSGKREERREGRMDEGREGGSGKGVKDGRSKGRRRVTDNSVKDS